MTFRLAALLVTSFLAAASARCFGQEAEDFPDSALTREQWQQRVEEARHRSMEFIANARAQPPPPLPADQLAREATDRAMRDPTLQPGDIISTNKGFVVFTGREEEHQPSDFQSPQSTEHPR
jgi:hypothetical protein